MSEDEDDRNWRLEMDNLMWALCVLVVVVLGGITVSKMIAKNNQEEAFIQRVYQLTPNGKPFFAYNSLQTSSFAFVTFDRFTGKESERVEVSTSGGVKVLVGGSASMTHVERDQKSDVLFDYLIERLMGCDKPDILWEGNRKRWDFARNRLFRLCEDLYVQIGIKVPPSTTRAEVERLNTRCCDPTEIWEALEADISQSIQSRSKVV
ncbi:MAG: hypothetical protein WC794_01345 [Candidatus Doudnabacteria bacterium]|jgi:hypothetical protein